LWPLGAAVILVISGGLVLKHWNSYNLMIKLIPVDVLTILLLIDLNIKSNSDVTLSDPVMKVEAVAFTGLLALILFVPVLWRLVFDTTDENR